MVTCLHHIHKIHQFSLRVRSVLDQEADLQHDLNLHVSMNNVEKNELAVGSHAFDLT